MSEPLTLRKFGHACVRIEVAGKVLVIDSGEFSEPESILGVDALLFTHAHYDHVSADRVKAAMEGNPAVEVWASEGAVPATGVQEVSILVPGQTVEVAGIPVCVSGGNHAVVYPGMDPGDNVALTVAGSVFHPGDSFTMPENDMAVVLAPISAPWSRLADVADYINAVSAGRVIPIHDALLSRVGIAAFDRNIIGITGAADTYTRLASGDSISL